MGVQGRSSEGVGSSRSGVVEVSGWTGKSGGVGSGCVTRGEEVKIGGVEIVGGSKRSGVERGGVRTGSREGVGGSDAEGESVMEVGS